MPLTLPMLLIIAALLLIFGVVAIVTIVVVAKRCRNNQNCTKSTEIEDSDGINPWEEAGKRMKGDFYEPI